MGAVILRRDSGGVWQVLLVRRAQEPLKGEWSLPGGAVELGETLQAAICREVQEETGLVVETIDVVEAFDRISEDAEGRIRFHYVLVDFLCRVVGGTLSCASDALEARWADADQLDGLTPLTVEVIHKALKMAS